MLVIVLLKRRCIVVSSDAGCCCCYCDVGQGQKSKTIEKRKEKKGRSAAGARHSIDVSNASRE